MSCTVNTKYSNYATNWISMFTFYYNFMHVCVYSTNIYYWVHRIHQTCHYPRESPARLQVDPAKRTLRRRAAVETFPVMTKIIRQALRRLLLRTTCLQWMPSRWATDKSDLLHTYLFIQNRISNCSYITQYIVSQSSFSSNVQGKSKGVRRKRSAILVSSSEKDSDIELVRFQANGNFGVN